VRQAQDAVTSAQAALNAAKHPYTRADIAYADAQLAQATQTLRSDKALLATDSELRAPAAGTILAVNIVSGQAAGSSGTDGSSGTGSASSNNGAVLIATDSRLLMTANVAEADIGSVSVGDPVDLTVSAFPGKRFTGKVTTMPFTATTATTVTTYPVQVTIDGPARELLSGMSAEVTIVTAHVHNVPVVPNAAIQTTAGGRFVRTLDPGNRIRRVRVRTGISDANSTQILAGLSPGRRILLPSR
jgi:multidrug efflux pump subunit AcrA (membrane-fusion protein)